MNDLPDTFGVSSARDVEPINPTINNLQLDNRLNDMTTPVDWRSSLANDFLCVLKVCPDPEVTDLDDV